MSKYILAPLEYGYDDLEPFIDKETMMIHHDKHHQTYVDKFNGAIEKYPELNEKTLEDLLKDLNSVPEDIRIAIKNHGGGTYNHAFFWKILKLNTNPESDAPELIKAVNKDFGSLDNFKEQFSQAATNHFGSGWAWLVKNNDKLSIIATPNQDCPLSQGLKPILCIDIWEHAYYLKYQNKRADYVASFWNVINWTELENNFKA